MNKFSNSTVARFYKLTIVARRVYAMRKAFLGQVLFLVTKTGMCSAA